MTASLLDQIVVSLLRLIASLLKGPDLIYTDSIATSATEKTLAFSGGVKIWSIDLFNSGANAIKVTFNAPAYRGPTPKTTANPTYTLPVGSPRIRLDFMGIADKMTYISSAGASTLEVFAMLTIAVRARDVGVSIQ